MGVDEFCAKMDIVARRLDRLHEMIDAWWDDETRESLLPELEQSYDRQLAEQARKIRGQVDTARRQFTIAVLGEFNCGKSTFLNALLGLVPASGLSTEEDPDTACSTLIRYRGENDPEARLVFDDAHPPRDVSWKEARGYTSQVWLSAHPRARAEARHLREVELYLPAEMLLVFNLNDLPGTGSRYRREHTSLTHDKMIEADAVFWIVGDEEPSAESLEDLAILLQAGQRVIPILNVFEDPTSDPPRERDDELVEEIEEVLMTEFSGYFQLDSERPLQISAKRLMLELARPEPREGELHDTGYDKLRDLLLHLDEQAREGSTRVRRLASATGGLLGMTRGQLEEVRDGLEPAMKALQQRERGEERLEDEMADVAWELRSRIQTLASPVAGRICQQVGDAGVLFVEDELQWANFALMKSALSKQGRATLNQTLTQKFQRDYLKFGEDGEHPEWLVAAAKLFAGQVRDVVVPEWRRLWRGMNTADEGTLEDTEKPPLDFDGLGQRMAEGILGVILNLLGVVGVFAILAAIPGGQIIDAIGVVVLAVWSMLQDPLDKPRRRAVRRVRLQTAAAELSLTVDLVQAGVDESSKFQEKLETHLRQSRTQRQDVVRSATRIRDLAEDILEEIREVGQWLEAYARGASS